MGIYVQTINRPSQTGLFTKFTFVYTFQQYKNWLSLQISILLYKHTEQWNRTGNSVKQKQDLCINSFQAVKIWKTFLIW